MIILCAIRVDGFIPDELDQHIWSVLVLYLLENPLARNKSRSLVKQKDIILLQSLAAAVIT